MIPTSKDLRALVGDYAEGVENRSLLYEKFSLPKAWGQERKLNDAGRWSVLRIVTRGSDLLKADAQRLRREASGRNVRPDVAQRKTHHAQIAEKMANIARQDIGVIKAATENASELLKDLERANPGRVVTFEATLGSRLLVNMAGGVVENAGICLDRCFGLPMLPGSAVKGIARSQALWEIKEARADAREEMLKVAMALFGYGANDIKRGGAFAWAAEGSAAPKEISRLLGGSDFKGTASFLPAYPTTAPQLVVDMVNSHYANYYSGRVPSAEDNEDPRPNYFPAVEAGCTFGFAVVLNRVPAEAGLEAAELLQFARRWIEGAVTRKGAGAKTAAGYGWFELGRPSKSEESAAQDTATAETVGGAAPATPADEFISSWKGRLNTKDNFPVALPAMAKLDDANLRRAFEAVIPVAEQRKLRRNNPYWQSFTSGRHEAAGKSILQRLGLKLI